MLELSSQGHSQPEIARILQITQPTVNRDIGYLRGQARQNLQKHIQDKLTEEYQNCMVGINQVLKICGEIVNNSRNVNNDNGKTVTMIDNKTVLQALVLINDCNKYKMNLTTNGVVIADAIKFVQINKERLSMSTKEENKESEEPDLSHIYPLLLSYNRTLQYINIGGKQPAKTEAYHFEMMAIVPKISIGLFVYTSTFFFYYSYIAT